MGVEHILSDVVSLGHPSRIGDLQEGNGNPPRTQYKKQGDFGCIFGIQRREGAWMVVYATMKSSWSETKIKGGWLWDQYIEAIDLGYHNYEIKR